VSILIVAIIVLLGLAAVVILATGRRRVATGRLSRETVARDESARRSSKPGTGLARADDESARERAAEARESIGGAVAEKSAAQLTKREPVDEEELGITRRQFFNRGILAGVGVSVGAFGVASLGFLWPSGSGGFGATITVGSLSQASEAFGKRQPFYNAAARTYVVPYPSEDLGDAEEVYGDQPTVFEGMEAGYVALFQRCVHLGCRVPWCQTSQWFECPCHGSKYNRVGEWKDGPAPRGLDRFGLAVEGDNLVVDTGVIWQGPPKGTNTTGQSAEGSPCV